MCGVIVEDLRQMRSEQKKRCLESLKLLSNSMPRILGEPLRNKQPLHLSGRALCILRLGVQLC